MLGLVPLIWADRVSLDVVRLTEEWLKTVVALGPIGLALGIAYLVFERIMMVYSERRDRDLVERQVALTCNGGRRVEEVIDEFILHNEGTVKDEIGGAKKKQLQDATIESRK